MADTPRQKFAALGKAKDVLNLPQIPRIPKQIKDRHPETAQAWSEYEAEWQRFFKELQTVLATVKS